jgi:hypothetical protein
MFSINVLQLTQKAISASTITAKRAKEHALLAGQNSEARRRRPNPIAGMERRSRRRYIGI